MRSFQSFEPPGSSAQTAQRVMALRVLMGKAGLDAMLIPHGDEYNNEYVPACAGRLAFISGFTGSAGLAAVTHKAAALFVDGRYAVQAPTEVDGSIYAVKGLPGKELKPWLFEQLKRGGIVGFDPRLHTIAEIEHLMASLAQRGVKLKPVRANLVDRVWGSERPAPPCEPIEVHPIEHAGRSAPEKIATLQKTLKDAGHDATILTAPDSICWLFNIRGCDVAHNPVVLARAIVPASGKAQLFVAPERLSGAAKTALQSIAKVRPPDELREALLALKAAGKAVRVAPGANWWICRTLGGLKRLKRAPDPCTEPKAIKNAAEIAGARAAHIRDGAAVTRFLAWLDAAVAAGPLDEIAAVERLEAFRFETAQLREISFPTISGSGPHGAIVHYRVTTATNRKLGQGELFLIDSGGQYADGTTDITRTVGIGAATTEMRERFTLVLKGMIAVSMARFPRGTRGVDLDSLARRALWKAGLDFDHGTGHGVGSYLNVHEGPQSISKGGMAELKPGMICSNEPGYYKKDAYGIRIENLVLVTDPEDVGGDRPVMGFETLTLAPIDRRLVEAAMLSGEERAWLDAYHARVAEVLGPLVDAGTRRWLKTATGKL